MRKGFVSIVVLLLSALLASACAEGLDYAGMSEAELQAIIAAATEELNRRGAPEANADGALHMVKGTVLMNQNDITVTLTGAIDAYGGSDSAFMQLEAIVENNSANPIYVNVDTCSINGWEVFGAGIADIGSGKKKKGNFMFMISDAEITRPEEIEAMELSFSIADADSWRTLFSTDGITLVP